MNKTLSTLCLLAVSYISLAAGLVGVPLSGVGNSSGLSTTVSNQLTFYWQTGSAYYTNPVVMSGSSVASCNGTFYWRDQSGAYTNAGSSTLFFFCQNDGLALALWTFGPSTNVTVADNTQLYLFDTSGADRQSLGLLYGRHIWSADVNTSAIDSNAVLTHPGALTYPIFTTNTLQSPLMNWVTTNLPFASRRIVSTGDVVFVDGDSRTAYPNFTPSWPGYLQNMSFFTNRYSHFQNVGSNGKYTYGATNIAIALQNYPITNSIIGYYIEALGVNDLGLLGLSADQLYTQKSNIWNEVHTNGYLVITCTIEGADTASYPQQTGTFELNRRKYNDLVRSSTLVDGVIDFDALYATLNVHDTNWYVDALHPTQLGHWLKAEYANACLFSIGVRNIKIPGNTWTFLPSIPTVPPVGYTNGVYEWNSNQVIYGVTATKTNLWHDMR